MNYRLAPHYPIRSCKHTDEALNARRQPSIERKKSEEVTEAGVRFYVIAANVHADMTESWSANDVDNAVVAIRDILKRFGALPQVLSQAYIHEIKTGDLMVTRRFYEQLALSCPDALDYFTASASGARDTDRPKPLRPIPIE